MSVSPLIPSHQGYFSPEIKYYLFFQMLSLGQLSCCRGLTKSGVSTAFIRIHQRACAHTPAHAQAPAHTHPHTAPSLYHHAHKTRIIAQTNANTHSDTNTASYFSSLSSFLSLSLPFSRFHKSSFSSQSVNSTMIVSWKS